LDLCYFVLGKISNRTSSVDAGGSDGGMSDASNNDNDFYFGYN